MGAEVFPHQCRNALVRLALPVVALTALSLMPATARAEIVIKELKLPQGYVVLRVSPDDGLTQGKILDLDAGGQPCSLKVYYVKGTQAAATTKGCPNANALEVGQSLGGSAGADAAAEAPKDESASERESKSDRNSADVSYHHFGAHVYYSFASSLNVKYGVSGTFTGTDGASHTVAAGTTLGDSYSSSGAPGIGLRYTLIKRDPQHKAFHLGAMIGYSYETSRKVLSDKDATGATANPTDLSLGVMSTEINLVAEYGKAYFFAGPNIGFVSFSGADSQTGGRQDFSPSGAMGYQVGAGLLLGKHFGLEAIYRVIGVQVDSLVVGLDTKTTQGALAGPAGRLQFYF